MNEVRREPLHEGECLSCIKLAARVQELERLTLANEMLKGCLAEEGRRLAAMRAERDAWKAAYEKTLRPKSVHSCNIPGCVSCANPGYTEDR